MSFTFVSGSAALDFVGTVGSRRSSPVDLLGGPSDLARWIRECDELPDQASVDARAFAGALDLREAIYRLTLDRMAGRPLDPAALATLNDSAAGRVPGIELTEKGARVFGDVRSVLTFVARDAIGVLANGNAYLKECGRPDCTRLYLDRSRGARRTWCGMKECGDRMKAAAYRARKRSATTDPGQPTNASPADVRE